ncbi:hemolysin [Chromobacterium sphagni]|uniref:Hemolysin n=2 Tax=Chromobacterium sphagni TaxID=1903179 RepID=A0A1S1WZY9_9NEIS|nr:DUF333 domain-containing protein [Chromobacterium sphagni]OHX12710.1 hemolysin [Chromobacterium sphagni]
MTKILTAAALALGLAACAQTSPTPPRPVGMANPASVYCVQQGGKLIPQKDASGGEYALCRLPDGREIEEWAYFREKHPG